MTKTTCQPPGSVCQVQTRVLGEVWGTGTTLPYLNPSVLATVGLRPALTMVTAVKQWRMAWGLPPAGDITPPQVLIQHQGWPRAPDPQYSHIATDIPVGSVSRALQGVWDPANPDPQGNEPQRGGSSATCTITDQGPPGEFRGVKSHIFQQDTWKNSIEFEFQKIQLNALILGLSKTHFT